jgi:Flp pilus assembly protein TadD
VSALVLAACASGGASETDAEAYREMLEAQRERAAATSSAEAARPPTVTDKLREGDGYRESGETGQAMWSYLQAHKLDRDDPEPVARIASLHLKEDPDRAEKLFLELAETHPESAPAHVGLGLAKLSKGDLPQAGASLRRAVELDPSSVVALSALGVIYDRLKMHDRAQKYYRQALAVQPMDYESLNNLGVSCMLTGDHAGAAAAFRQAAALEPRDQAVQNNLGMALAGMEQYDEALEAFRKGGDEQGALNNLAYAYYLNGEYQEAIAHYERALLAEGNGKVTILRNLRLAREAFALEGGAQTASNPGNEAWKQEMNFFVPETTPERDQEHGAQTATTPGGEFESPPEAEPQDDAQTAATPSAGSESTPEAEPQDDIQTVATPAGGSESAPEVAPQNDDIQTAATPGAGSESKPEVEPQDDIQTVVTPATASESAPEAEPQDDAQTAATPGAGSESTPEAEPPPPASISGTDSPASD